MSRSVTIADDAYASLKEHKKDGESFSDTVRKLSKCGCPSSEKEQPEKTERKRHASAKESERSLSFFLNS